MALWLARLWFWRLTRVDDQVFLLTKTANKLTVHEKRLRPIEKAMKGEVVTKALRAWIDNEALRR
eukprot:12428539-Prorocentrum_lima.AAC.1